MSDIIAVLDRDHANIAKLLDLLESEILAIEVGKTPDYPLLQDIMHYMAQYPDRFHHPKEDVVFAQLVKRDPSARADVDELLKEHASIVSAGEKFDRLLRTTVPDSVDMREKLRTLGFAYIRAFRKHMLKEEIKLFPLAMAVLTRKDWLVIDEKIDAIIDPLFGTTIADEYQTLYRSITDRTQTDGVTRNNAQ